MMLFYYMIWVASGLVGCAMLMIYFNVVINPADVYVKRDWHYLVLEDLVISIFISLVTGPLCLGCFILFILYDFLTKRLTINWKRRIL